MHKISSNSLFVGKKLVRLPKCHSTNQVAAEMLVSGLAYEGTLIITDHQTAGKGQRGNSWESEPGKNLTFSVILKPGFLLPHQQFWLTIVSSLAVHHAVGTYVSGATIKWPNDIYAGDRKLGGILIENNVRGRRIESSVVGIGLNVNQLSFSNPQAASLSGFTGQSYDLSQLLEEICRELERLYMKLRTGHLEDLKNLYLNHLLGMGEWRSYVAGSDQFEGMILGVTEAGQLRVLKTDGEQLVFDIKEIRFIL